MRTIARLTVGAVLVFGVGACSSESPTGASLAPSAPRYSGVTFGSGNAVGGAGSGDVTGGGTAATQSVAADSGSTATRGVTFGSGN